MGRLGSAEGTWGGEGGCLGSVQGLGFGFGALFGGLN